MFMLLICLIKYIIIYYAVPLIKRSFIMYSSSSKENYKFTIFNINLLHLQSVKEPILTTRVKKYIAFLLSIITLLGLAGCEKSSVKTIDEGEIHYKIIYNDRQGAFPEELMPNMLIVKFKNDKSIMEITAPIGKNGIYNLFDPGNKTNNTYISFLGLNYFYIGEPGEIPPGIDPMEDMILEKTDDVKDIGGYKCKHATAKIDGLDRTFDIWYTTEIDLSKPNSSTPYKELDGVLLNFFYRMGEMIVEFEAKGIYQRPVPDRDFEKGDEFRRIKREDMDSIISKMMSL